MHRALYPLVFAPLLISCGKKAPPVPPPPPAPPEHTVGKPKILKGEGGYFIGDDGIAALYWSFPVKVDYAQILLGEKLIATTGGSTYIYPHPLEGGKTYTFKVVGIRGGKPVVEVDIEVSP